MLSARGPNRVIDFDLEPYRNCSDDDGIAQYNNKDDTVGWLSGTSKTYNGIICIQSAPSNILHSLIDLAVQYYFN
jgi:hypothetical protein